MSRDPFDFSIQIPEDWISHDPERAGRVKSTEAAVDERIRENPVLGEARRELVERMLGFAETADDKAAMAAASLWTVVGNTEVAANMMVLAADRRVPGDVEGELAALEEELGAGDSLDVGPRDVRLVELPAGRAVRLRVVVEGEPERREPGVVLEVVQHWLPVPDATHTLIVSCTTPCLAYGDELATVFDSIAGSLRLT